MPPIVEFVFVTFTMLGAFILVFILVFLLALVLFPIEKELSKMVWSRKAKAILIPPKVGSFKDFSKKH